jgi:hypothetical protein
LHGFGGAHKLASLKSLLLQTAPVVAFLQETLVSVDKAMRSFLKCLPSWNCVALDPNGISGGLLASWNPPLDELNALGSFAGIYLEGRFRNTEIEVKLFNWYAPYKDHESFCQPIVDSGILKKPCLILRGDLNFTLSSREICGFTTRIDPLSDYFLNILQDLGLVDLAPSHLFLTWRNGCSGKVGISKCIERFLVDENLLSSSISLMS